MAKRANPSAVRSRKQPEPEINVTPLVDVVLVLLIIFMVITPQITKNPIVALPSARAPDDKAKDVDPIDVILKKDGTIIVTGDVMPAEAAAAKVGELHRAGPDRKVLLEADASLPYKKVRDVFAMLQASGSRGIALKVIERKSE